MALRNWIHKKERIATATVATRAKVSPNIVRGVAKVSGVAVAEPKKQKISLLSEKSPASEKPCDCFQISLPIRTWTPACHFACSCGDCTGWTLDGKPLCPVCYRDRFYGPDPAVNRQDLGVPPRQIICKSYKHNGILMATTPESCRKWQGPFCSGCELYSIH